MAGKTSKSQAAYYAMYKSTNKWKTNREKRLLKAMQEQPNNKQIEEALANLRYRRKKPTNPQWSSSDRKIAQLLKEFTGKAPHACFSSNPQVQAAALQGLHGVFEEKKLPVGKVDFSLAARSWSKNPV